jgi:hypothetical protein
MYYCPACPPPRGQNDLPAWSCQPLASSTRSFAIQNCASNASITLSDGYMRTTEFTLNAYDRLLQCMQAYRSTISPLFSGTTRLGKRAPSQWRHRSGSRVGSIFYEGIADYELNKYLIFGIQSEHGGLRFGAPRNCPRQRLCLLWRRGSGETGNNQSGGLRQQLAIHGQS